MPSLSALLGFGAATLFSVASATKYAPADTYAGSSFFDHFDFVTVEKTNGFVKYVDRSRAEDKQYIRYENGDAIFGVDYKSTLDSSDGKDIGRESVRLEGKTEYNKGLFVLDLKHMPGGICGSWPAFWSLGREPWPVKGEIDIIEGVNLNSVNKFVLHTDTKCKVNGLGQTGSPDLLDCAYDTAGASGCGVSDARTKSYGTAFNANEGGHYVTEWQAEGIKIWFFPRGTAPKSLTTSEPDTSEFGTPAASFQGDCDIEKRFMDQRFIFTNTFCGDWGGNVYAQSGCPMYNGLDGMASCKKYVAEHPEVFKDAYWRVSSFKTYNKRGVTSSSSIAPSSTSRASSSSVHASSSSVQTSSSSIQTSSSSIHVSSSSTRVSSSSVQVSSSSVQVSSSSVHASSSSVHASSSSVASSSSALSSSALSSSALSSSALSSSMSRSSTSPTPTVSSSLYPSSTPAASSTPVSSSSITHDVSSSIEHISSSTMSVSPSETPYDPTSSSSVAQDTSSTMSTSASETPYEPFSSSSVAHDYSSGISSTASETPKETASSSSLTYSVSESSYSPDVSSTVISVSTSETPYPHDSSSVYPTSSVIDVSSVYPSETPDASSSAPYSSDLSSFASSYSATSASASPDTTHTYSVGDKSSSSTSAYYTSAPVYSVYPEGDGYGHGSVISKTSDASSKISEYPVVSSKNPEYDGYPVASSSASSSASDYPKSTPVYADYPELPSFTPLYSTYPTVSSKPSYGDDHKSTASPKATTAYETTYVDICPTGYTTITTKVTAIETPAPYPTTDGHYAPPGFEVTTKYCAQGCGEGPKTVTVTIPCSKCQASTPVPYKPTDVPINPTGDNSYVATSSSKPSTPEDSTTKITATKIITLTTVPVPESEYPATHGSAAPSAKHPDSDADKSYANDKPVAPTGSAPASKPVSPSGSTGGDKPVYPTAIGYQGLNVTVSYGTATSAYSKPSQTGYNTPEFTGAASRMTFGGVVAAAISLFAAMMM